MAEKPFSPQQVAEIRQIVRSLFLERDLRDQSRRLDHLQSDRRRERETRAQKEKRSK